MAITSTAMPLPCLLVCLTALWLLFPPAALAQNSKDDYLRAHNTARAVVGVGSMTWEPALASYAQGYASLRVGDCKLIQSGGPYGENLASGSGHFTGTDAVNSWVGEKTYYDYASNTCATGEECGNYTQVVWRESVGLGCARVQCNSGKWFVICSYDPPGNQGGERPYYLLNKPY